MKLVLLFILLSSGVDSFGQEKAKDTLQNGVEVGKVTVIGFNFIECLKYSEYDSYLFTFKNESHFTLDDDRSFWIKGDENFNKLYDDIVTTLAEKKTQELEIEIGDKDMLFLKFKRNYVRFWHWKGDEQSYSTEFKLKQIKELFGKE